MATIEETIIALGTELAGRITRISAIYIFELGDAAFDKARVEEFCKELSGRIKRDCDDLINKLCEISGVPKSLMLERMDTDIPNAVEAWQNAVAA